MNQVSKIKQFIAQGVAAIGVLVILTPATALAANTDRAAVQAQNAQAKAAAQEQRTQAKTAAAQAKVNAFCTNLSNSTRPIVAKVQENRGKATSDWSTKDANLASQWQQADQKITTARAEADAKRAANYEKLMAKATTDEQKAAVEAYEQAVNNAVAARRASYDSARQTFRNSVQSTIAARRSVAQSQLSTFQSSVNSAIANAQASCASNPTDISGIKATLQSNLKSARENFQAVRKTDNPDAVKGQIQQLIAARNASFESANTTFKNTIDQARANLQQVFGNNSAI